MNVRPGTFTSTYGTLVENKKITFTFCVRRRQPAAVLIYDSDTFQLLEEIPVESDCRRGNVCSLTVEGFDPAKVCYLLKRDGEIVMDPYAKKVIGRDRWNDPDRSKTDYRVFGGFIDHRYRWRNTERTPLAPEDVIVYKLHMRGFTMQHGLGTTQKGNVKGFLRRLDEIADLGFTAVEFMPIYDFEEVQLSKSMGIDAQGRTTVTEMPAGRINYWGYGPAAYMAPKASYFLGERADLETKKMVDAIHERGMEIYMEMAFAGGTPEDVMVDALDFWVNEYHVDGFRLIGMGLPAERIAEDPYLADTKLFYDLFPQNVLDRQDDGKHLFVCNDDFMYSLRRLQNHMGGSMPEFTGQMRRQNEHYGFVNYAANSNGFTLYDAYSYGEKHNEANGEENRDGNNNNYSNNYGVEGRTTSRAVIETRLMHVRTALASVLLGQGIPMILSGDELLNTQGGNNNAYCQDNATGWVQYFNGRQQKELKEFVKRLISFRKTHKTLHPEHPLAVADYRHLGIPDVSYHGREPWILDIGQERKSVGILYSGAYAQTPEPEDIMMCYNFHYDWENFTLPKLPDNREWFVVGNTRNYGAFAEDAESEASKAAFETPVRVKDQTEVIVPGGSLTLLVARPAEEPDEKTE